MISSLQLIYHRLLETVNLNYYRYLCQDFPLDNRLIGLIGPRSVGKTTLMLQLIKNHFKNNPKVFYFSADHLYCYSNNPIRFY